MAAYKKHLTEEAAKLTHAESCKKHRQQRANLTVSIKTRGIMQKYKDDEMLGNLTWDQIQMRILKLAGIIKPNPKLGIPQLKGRYDE